MRRKTIPLPVPKQHGTSPLWGGLGGFLLLCSCRSPQVVVEHRVERDTVYKSIVCFDSTYVSHDVWADRSKDTILIREHDTEYRYRLLHDTIREVRIDSIPYPVTITKREEVPRPLNVFDYLAYGSLFIVLIYLYKKLKGYVL